MSDLIKLDNIAKRKGNIKAFTLDPNFKRGQIGKLGWGEMTIAVDNETIKDYANGDLIGVLYITSREEWEKEKNK